MEEGRFGWYAKSHVCAAAPSVETLGCEGVAVLVNRGNDRWGVRDDGRGTEM